MFCRKDRKLTKEHLWPRWARRTFDEPEREELVPHSIEVQGGVEVKTWGAPAFTSTLRVVCEECNGGWMSALENRAQTYAEPLILGEPQTLDQEAKVAISMWAYLKVLLFQLQPEAEPVLPQETFDTLFLLRAEDLLPLNTSIFLAHHAGPRQGQYQHRVLALPGSDSAGCLVATFTIRELAVQVIKNNMANEPLLFERDPRLGDVEALIWPATPDPVQWPPPESLDDEGLTIYTGPQPKRRVRAQAKREVRRKEKAKNRARNKAARKQRRHSQQ